MGLNPIDTAWMVVSVLRNVIDVALEEDQLLLGSFFLLCEIILSELFFVLEGDVVI